MFSDEEILFMYGKNAVISRKDRFTFVHLDRPSAALVRVRTENFDPDEFFQCFQHDHFSLCGCEDYEQVTKVFAVFASVSFRQKLACASDRLAFEILALREHIEAGQ